MENRIPVVLASDNNQVHAMATVIGSVLQVAKSETAYDFFCLIADDVSAENRARLLECQTRKNSVTLVDMKPWIEPLHLQYHKISGLGHSISTPTLYRILIPSILSKFNRAIYLDTDVVCLHDLKTLFEQEIGENLLAGVPAVWTVKKCNRERWMRAGFPSLDSYINCGVLLLNLDLMRRLEIERKCLELMTKTQLLSLDGDQAVLNFACLNKISFIPLRYNVTTSHLKHSEKMPVFFTKREVMCACDDPCIFHWTGALKPWKYYDVPLAHIWWKFYRKSPFADVPLARISQSDYCSRIFKSLKGFFKID